MPVVSRGHSRIARTDDASDPVGLKQLKTDLIKLNTWTMTALTAACAAIVRFC
jgi:hypothetical protein